MEDLKAKCNFTLEEMQEPNSTEQSMQHSGSQIDIPDHNLCFPNNLI
jgi:hypothetical protein